MAATQHGQHGRRQSQQGGRRAIGAAAIALALTGALLGGACTGGGDESVDVITEAPDADGERAALADDNAYSSAGGRMEGAQVDGGWLDVEYFEALRKGEWVAPDHCWFSTRVSVNDTLASDGFAGPSSDLDRDAGDGLLVGALQSSIAVPQELPPDTTVPTDDTTGTTVVGSEPYPDASWSERPAVLAVAVVYGHDQVVELRSDDPSVIEGHGLESQPLDGWNMLRVALDPETAPGDGVNVTLRRVHEDGTETSEDLRIPLGGDGLELRTEAWRFDLAAVDGSCEVPGGEVDNTPAPTETDILGSPVGEAPRLPAPGEQPADPTAAADQALASLRSVYDITDVYSAEKREHIEDPEAYDQIRQALIANDVVGPYMSNLDPQFRSAVFVSPTEAHILYKVGPSYQWEIGRVLLIDGRWRVAAGTFCRDLSAAGYTCPGVVKDPRPGPLG